MPPRTPPGTSPAPRTSTRFFVLLTAGVVGTLALITAWDAHRRTVYHGRSLDEWLAALDDSSAGVRDTAAYALTRLSPQSAAVLGTVIRSEAKMLADPDSDVRAEATSALITLGRGSHAVVPVVASVLTDTRGTTSRVQALEVLTALGPDATPAQSSVLRALHDTSAGVRLMAVSAISRMAPSPTSLANVLALTTDPDPGVRGAAIEALVELKAPADTLRSIAARAAHDPDPIVREQAAYATQATTPRRSRP
jgi:HEAT repeat protein